MTDQQETDDSDEAYEAEHKKLQSEADKADAEGEDDTTQNVEEAESEQEAPEAEQESEDTDSPEIPVRDSASHIIARKTRTIEKLRSKLDEKDDEEPIEADDEDELVPESRDAVQKEVQRQVAPLVDSLAKKSDEDELQELLTSEPEAKGYEKRIRAYMDHDSYQGVPPSVIYHHLAFGNAESEGARRKQVADLEAEQMSGTGSTSRPVDRPTGDIPTAEEIDDMSDEEFDKLEGQARAGKFVPD